jgi:hypothetical protein
MKARPDDLLNWYLAHLRKNALSRKTFQDLTPMALVDSDKEMLRRIVEESAHNVVAVPSFGARLSTNSWMIQLALTVSICGLLLITLCITN